MKAGIMGSGKQCDSCKSGTATLFCRADSAYLCLSCDSNIHAANKLASRHARVWLCEVCEQSPATVTCKADAAHLCPTCDRDIHSANPLARRHDRVPLSPFFDPPNPDSSSNPDAAAAAATSAAISKLFGDEYYSDSEEAEAASWLLANPKAAEEHKSIDFLFAGGDDHKFRVEDPYLGMDFAAEEEEDDPKPDPSVDCVVPDPAHSMYSLSSYNHNFENGYDTTNVKHHYPIPSFAPPHPHPQPSLSHSVSSSSLEYGVVPDANPMVDVASTGVMEKQQMKMMGLDREARVMRYREKRKNRKFEKTIRYASRKAYAETRPRIKGRFAKRSEVEAASVDGLFASDSGYGVVPSF